MSPEKQVNKDHYEFKRYMSLQRWISVWHQLDEVISLEPSTVLEVGPGNGIFKNAAQTFGLRVETLDLDPELQPDHLASATDMPFRDDSYDVVCAFQMLEHLPYEVSLSAFKEMCRVARRHVVISLPNAEKAIPISTRLPKLGIKRFHIPLPFLRKQQHVFDGEHYWEISKLDYPLSRIVGDFSKDASLLKSYRVPEYPYHQFFIFSKT